MAPPVPDPNLPTARDIEQLNGRIDALNRHMAIMIKREVETKAVPRQELQDRLRASGKRTLAGLVLVLLVALSLVGMNRLTLTQADKQAQRDLSHQVTQCFLNAGANTKAQAAECSRRFGAEYTRSQQRSAQTLGVFVKLQERVKHLEDEVARLKE